jgi:hypothetical protein
MADTTCPVAEMGREIAALWRAFGANEDRSLELKEGAEHDRLERANAVIVDRRDALEELAAFTLARSLQGAMLQVALANEEADAISSYREEGYATTVEEHGRRLNAALHSVVRLLEQLSGVSRQTVGAENYISADFDPHPALAAALTGKPLEPAG